jgi:hypothetical protein
VSGGPLSKEGSDVLCAARDLVKILLECEGVTEEMIQEKFDMTHEDPGSIAVHKLVMSVRAYEKALAEFEHM